MGMYAFRLDDITPDMNWNHFNRICSIFEKYNIKPLLGVVPDNHDHSLRIEDARDDFWECIRKLQENGYSISQHGYKHLYETKNRGILGLSSKSEFAGLPFSIQDEKIRRGKEILQKKGIYVNIFMAPSHTFDRNTLRALKKNGFLYLSDGYANRNYSYKGICFIPSRASKPELSHNKDTICLHLNKMREKDFSELEKFIIENRKNIKNFDELMGQRTYPRIWFIVEEKKNLWIRKIKNNVSNNYVIHQFLQETASKNKKIQWKKRLLGIPTLLCRISRKR